METVSLQFNNMTPAKASFMLAAFASNDAPASPARSSATQATTKNASSNKGGKSSQAEPEQEEMNFEGAEEEQNETGGWEETSEETTEEEADPEITPEMIRSAMGKYSKKNGAAKANALYAKFAGKNKKGEAKKATELDQATLAKILKAVGG